MKRKTIAEQEEKYSKLLGKYYNKYGQEQFDPEAIWEFSELTYLLLSFEKGSRLPDLRTPKGELLPKAISCEERDFDMWYACKYYPNLYSKPIFSVGNWLSTANKSRAFREGKELAKKDKEEAKYGS